MGGAVATGTFKSHPADIFNVVLHLPFPNVYIKCAKMCCTPNSMSLAAE